MFVLYDCKISSISSAVTSLDLETAMPLFVCCIFHQEMLLLQCLSLLGKPYYKSMGSNLQHTYISSRGNSNATSHFKLQKVELLDTTLVYSCIQLVKLRVVCIDYKASACLYMLPHTISLPLSECMYVTSHH